jgi:hypothetical protein
MGTKERHERDRHRIRQGILDAARELFIAEGYQHVSMRKIADRIEYSPAAIYSYFPRKDDIFFASLPRGSTSWLTASLPPWPVSTIRSSGLRRGLRAFYQFSKINPSTSR